MKIIQFIAGICIDTKLCMHLNMYIHSTSSTSTVRLNKKFTLFKSPPI